MKNSTLPSAVFFMLILISCHRPNQMGRQGYIPPRKMAGNVMVLQIPHDTLCITAVGDIMMGTSYPTRDDLPPDNGKRSFRSVAKYLKKSDVTFGNLEGDLLDDGAPAPYKRHFKGEAYLFRMPRKFAPVLKKAGFNLLSIANNHIGDFDLKGRTSTMRTLDSCTINYAGVSDHPASIFKINGVTYGFCAFAPNYGTESILKLEDAAKIIRQLKKRCDVVIVGFHGGAEGNAYEHIPFKSEIYYGENRGDVHAFAHNAIDAGADVVLGTGPHVGRAMEVYKDRFIAYSLGNFCTYKHINVNGISGIAPLLKIYVNREGKFLNGRIIAVKQTDEDGVERDYLNRAVKRIKMLTAADFPQGKLKIGDDGYMTVDLVRGLQK